MKRQKKLLACILSLFLISQPLLTLNADVDVEPLQLYFSDDGKVMRIFTSQKLDDNAEVIIGNQMFSAEEIQNSNVEVHTTFLIDNSTSMPKDQREPLIDSISNYVAIMPDFESVKIATFDENINFLADDYSSDSGFIDYELSKVDFQGKASLVYDALLKSVDYDEYNENIYYRTILITDGVDSNAGTSFDFLRTEISENGRFHVDVIQVNKDNSQDVNLLAISHLGSNTYTVFQEDTELSCLQLKQISMMKVSLINDITTGEVKGVTIQNENEKISLGSVRFPQVIFSLPEITEEIEETEGDSLEIIETSETVSETVSPSPKPSFSPFLSLIIVGILLLLAGIGVGCYIWLSKKNCTVMVRILKEDFREKELSKQERWEFSIFSECRIGRTLTPTDSNGKKLPKNHYVVCETATKEDMISIGRNAFSLKYHYKDKNLYIKNIAQNATFVVEDSSGRQFTLSKQQCQKIEKNSKILIGNYTTIIIDDIIVDKILGG